MPNRAEDALLISLQSRLHSLDKRMQGFLETMEAERAKGQPTFPGPQISLNLGEGDGNEAADNPLAPAIQGINEALATLTAFYEEVESRRIGEAINYAVKQINTHRDAMIAETREAIAREISVRLAESSSELDLVTRKARQLSFAMDTIKEKLGCEQGDPPPKMDDPGETLWSQWGGVVIMVGGIFLLGSLITLTVIG